MPRPSVREERRAEIVEAYARVLARHGQAGATVVAIAEEAGVSPGLLHHHFRDKRDLLDALLDHLRRDFLARTRGRGGDLSAWIQGALARDGGDPVLARCWVAVLAEAMRDPDLLVRVRHLLGGEVVAIRRRAPGFDDGDAAALLAFTVGALVVGTVRPDLTGGRMADVGEGLAAQLDGGGPSRGQ